MRIGIFAKTFKRDSLAETLDAVRMHGFSGVQFNMACAGMTSMPERVDETVAAAVKKEAAARAIRIEAVSGTFNMSHPDAAVRQEGLTRLGHLAAMCAEMGVRIITVGSGSRNPQDMWSPHPDNGSAEAWRDMLDCMGKALAVAEQYGVVLALEPEAANVVKDAHAARQVLEIMASRRLQIVFDAANLVAGRDRDSWPDVLKEAADMLGGRIVLAHAKDIRSGSGIAPQFAAVGQGELDFGGYLRLLKVAGFDGPVVMHGLDERDAAGSLSYLQNLI